MKTLDNYTILLATNNSHKAEEFQAILGDNVTVKTMKDLGIFEEPIEDGETIEDNANIKSNFLKDHLTENLSDYIIMADDTGLFVDALDGEPGVYSARYAGEECSFADNNNKLLKNLADIPKEDRGAHFSTSISFILPNGALENLTANVDGAIAPELLGDTGFGYDPVFIEETTGKTYAQMTSEEKNQYSHRKKAIEKVKAFINKWLENEENRLS